MAQVQARLIATKRWFYYPVAIAMVVLGRLGILTSPERAAKWLVDHAMRFEVR